MLELFRGGDGGRDELFSFEGEGAFLGGEGGGVDDVDVGSGFVAQHRHVHLNLKH